MIRNIVLLSDGTGNSAAKLFRTNVWRTYQALDLSTPNQVAFYDDGVGTSKFKPLAFLGGAFGWGLKRNLIALYMFLCRNYKAGDRIYGFGFSRGAFTIRVLTRFILSEGLVSRTDYGSSRELKRKSLRLYRNFRRKEAATTKGFRIADLVRAGFYYVIDCFNRTKTPKTCPIPHIEFLGLWDTVDAYGLPIDEFKTGFDRYIWPLRLWDKFLDGRIVKACHALALDDTRMTFHPLLWDETKPPYSRVHNHTDAEKLTQVWFAGAHSNVGGGYPDDGLSYVSLRWVICEAGKRGLIFTNHAKEEIATRAAPFGRLYNSRRGLGAYYRYEPRRLPATDKYGATIPCPKIHESVPWRMALGVDTYVPLSLPAELRIVTEHGDKKTTTRQNVYSLERYQQLIQESETLFGTHIDAGADKRQKQRLVGEIGELERPNSDASQLMWATVWWRRVAYTATLVTTMLLAISPALYWHVPLSPHLTKLAAKLANEFYIPVDAIATIGSAFIAILEPAVLFALTVAISFFPTFTHPWLERAISSVWVVTLLLLVLVMFVKWGSLIDSRIHDRAIAIWNKRWKTERSRWFRRHVPWRFAGGCLAALVAAISAYYLINLYVAYRPVIGWFGLLPCDFIPGRDCSLRPNQVLLFFAAGFAVCVCVGAIVYILSAYRLIKRSDHIRTELPSFALSVAMVCSKSLPTSMYLLTRHFVIPIAFVLMLGVLAGVWFNRFMFAFSSELGRVCKETIVKPTEFRGNIRRIVVKDVELAKGCVDSGVDVRSGFAYWIGVEGLSSASHSWWRPIVTPIRRELMADWLVPIVRVGGLRGDEFTIEKGNKTIIPHKEGRVFLFLNEAVLGLPFIWDVFYGRQNDIAKVTVTVTKCDVSVVSQPRTAELTVSDCAGRFVRDEDTIKLNWYGDGS